MKGEVKKIPTWIKFMVNSSGYNFVYHRILANIAANHMLDCFMTSSGIGIY